MASFHIRHVYRHHNREADALANEAMDEVSVGRTAGAPNEPRKAETAANAPIRVRARFRSGVLYPLEDIDLPDGAEVEILLRASRES